MFPLPGIQNAARARWSTLCVRQSLLEVAREDIFLYRKTFDRFLAEGGGEDTPMYSRDDCAVLTNFDERFGALRSVLSVNRKNLFAYCACLPTYLPTVHPFPCHAIGRSHILRCCLELRYFALLLCALSTKRGNVHSQSSEIHVHTYDARVRLGACCLLYIMVHVPRQQRRGRCCPWPHSLHA